MPLHYVNKYIIFINPIMESMVKILNECLKDSNLETISKAELRKKYLEKTGLKKLPKEDKELFSSAVDTAFLNLISNETKAVGNVHDTKIMEASVNEIKENGGDGEFVTDSSSSDDEITSANINENVLAVQFANGVNDIKMESTSDSDEKSLASYKNIATKKSSNDLEKQRRKRALSSSSEDEIIQNKLTKRSQVMKKSRKSSEAEPEANISKITKNKDCFKKAKVESSDSEDELLTVLQKKLNSSRGSKKFDLSKDESLSKYPKKQLNNAIDSDDEPVMPSNRKKVNSVNGLKNNLSDSEDEPLTKFKKASDSINLKGVKMKFKTKKRSNNSDEYMKSKKNCDSEDKPLTKYQKANDSIHSGKYSNSIIKKSNSSNKPFISNENTSDSENEPVLTLKKKKSNLYDFCVSKNSSSESENECIAKYSKKEVNNSIDSDEELASEKSNAINGLLKLSKNLSDSEDEPLNKLGNKKMGNSNDFEKEPVKKIVKGEVKHSLEKSLTNGNKSKEQTIKIKKFVDSDDDNISNQNKRKSSCEQKNYLLSDLSEDEPKEQTLGKKKKRIVDSDNEENIANQKKEKSFNAQNDFPISDSSEDEPLVNLKSKESKNSSDFEDESLDKLSNKTGNSSNNAKESVKKIVKVKHTLKKTKKSSKPNEQTFGKMKKRIVDSDSDVNMANQEKEKSFDELKDFPISDSSEDEPFVNLKSKESKNSNDSEDEPLDKLSNKTSNSSDNIKQSDKKIMKEVKHTLKKTKKSSKPKDQTFGKKQRIVDSDNEENMVNQEKEKSFDGQNDSPLSDSNEDEPLLSITQKEPKIASDSENEPLNKLSTKKSDKKQKSSESGSSSYVDENEEHSTKKNKQPESKEANDSGKGKKRPSASENKIEHLKKYVRAAGIRIQNYNKLFETCKTMKAKCEKLMSLLEKEGLKGRPTLEKCKKLKKKIETKREIAELDLSNILKEGGGRPKRSACSDTTNCKPEEEISAPIKKFSRLQDIFDSEESD